MFAALPEGAAPAARPRPVLPPGAGDRPWLTLTRTAPPHATSARDERRQPRRGPALRHRDGRVPRGRASRSSGCVYAKWRADANASAIDVPAVARRAAQGDRLPPLPRLQTTPVRGPAARSRRARRRCSTTYGVGGQGEGRGADPDRRAPSSWSPSAGCPRRSRRLPTLRARQARARRRRRSSRGRRTSASAAHAAHRRAGELERLEGRDDHVVRVSRRAQCSVRFQEDAEPCGPWCARSPRRAVRAGGVRAAWAGRRRAASGRPGDEAADAARGRPVRPEAGRAGAGGPRVQRRPRQRRAARRSTSASARSCWRSSTSSARCCARRC